jgi:hypothetical protein
MKKLKIILLLSLFLNISFSARADEGMWLLSLLNGYTIEDMQKEGFKLTAEDIYSVNEACLKDAVVIFGGGCTGELISNEGLLLTNHHCGYGQVQAHSSVENDYLTDGFWAMSREEELVNPGLSVTFLRYMDDVTDKIMAGIEDGMPMEERAALMEQNVAGIRDEAEDDGKFEVTVRAMFYGNQYFVFVYERYLDVRLVGAPPSSIGNFGEDNDNWMWPRHTGDFTVFRVYANEANEPAKFSPENKPYVPKKSLEISMDGVQEGDFTMLVGYPGSTQQFLYSDALETMTEQSFPMRIELRTKRLEIMDKYMKESDLVRIQYASKYRGVSNAWKKWQGVIRGLDRLDAINTKRAEEKEFERWLAESPERSDKYGKIFTEFEDIYSQLSSLGVLVDLQREAIYAVELFRFSGTINRMMEGSVPVERIRSYATDFYKNYHHPIDEEIFASMMSSCFWYMDETYHPEFFQTVQKKYKRDFRLFASDIYNETIYRSAEEFAEIVDLYEQNPQKALKKVSKEPLIQYMTEFRESSGDLSSQYSLLQSSLNYLYKDYVKGIMEMHPDQIFYPDANFTMRIAYGKVEGYEPLDATMLRHYTKLSGVMEKSRMGKSDYVIPSRLEDLYNAKDFGRYGVDGTMPVCFSASNHSSGGNSGSPVLDANGRLIGINFDRNWEGTMSDEMYDLSQCRNISVDIRYVLFIIDKYAGAGYLLDEMVLVESPQLEEPEVPAEELVEQTAQEIQ